MVELIRIALVVLYAIGSIAIALGLVKIAVVRRRYWLRLREKTFLFSRLPRGGNALLFLAMLFLLAFIIFFLAIFSMIPPTNQIPRLAALSLLIIGDALACFSTLHFLKVLEKRRLKA